MSLGPLVPRSDASRNNDGSRALLPGETPEFLRPISSALYNALPSQESTLREYMRVLIKRKWMVISVIVGIFMAVAIASLRQTPIYVAVGRIAINKADSNLITFKDSGPVVDYYDQSDLDTEVRILQSDLMALQVIRSTSAPSSEVVPIKSKPTWWPIRCRLIRTALRVCWALFAATSASPLFPIPESLRFTTTAPIPSSPPAS